MGFAEAVYFMFEPVKGIVHKADTRVKNGIFLGYKWRTTEYLVGTGEGIYNCGKGVLDSKLSRSESGTPRIVPRQN